MQRYVNLILSRKTSASLKKFVVQVIVQLWVSEAYEREQRVLQEDSASAYTSPLVRRGPLKIQEHSGLCMAVE